MALYPFHGADEVHGVCLMLPDACAHREDVHVEDDVLWRESYAGQQLVCSFGYRRFPFVGCGLPLLVEGHHHNCGPQLHQQACLVEELRLAALQAYGVDDALALCVLQSCNDRWPVAAVYHQHGAGYGRVARDIPAEGLHLLAAVEHSIVHVDVDDAGAALYLMSGHGERLVVFLLCYQPGKLP